jgi:hypothetical protein
MQLLKRLLQIISSIAPGPALSEKELQALTRLNPDKFYVENVRSLLDVPYQVAFRLCETAVRQGVFARGIEVKCPDGAVAVVVDGLDELPEEVRCWKMEDGHMEPEMVPTDSLEKASFYRLNAESDAAPYTRSA